MDVYFEVDGEQFVWNAAKAERNWRKHGVQFEEAAIGFDAAGRLLYVVHFSPVLFVIE
ncbi:MAG: BrnT family toxin [Gammaproteobacteria bacterium]|nr:BrnT family toxin [Gammaproteobacteria bacterium]MBU1655683.1 BrnT family toxin [Gammaproteobacteria bacterium]MBU1961171.1 BrnT family toxin [Gammaproteobacteria bacterium]